MSELHDMLINGYRQLGRLAGTLIVIADSTDHDEAVGDAKEMLRELAKDRTLPDELVVMCRDAAKRKKVKA